MDSEHVEQQVSAQAVVLAGELPMATWEPTGDPDVDAVLTRMLGLGSMTLAEQGEVFDGIHRSLRERLVNAATQPAEAEVVVGAGLAPQTEPDPVTGSIPEQDSANSTG